MDSIDPQAANLSDAMLSMVTDIKRNSFVT